MTPSRPARRLGLRLLALFAAVPLGLVAAELVARLFEPPPRQAYVWEPGLQRVFRPAPGVMPGIEGESRFQIDSVGLRGDDPDARDAVRVLTVGGSTTECLYLDQDEAWPQLVQVELRARSGERVWVGNAGRSGHTTREHVFQVDTLVAREPKPDVVVLMAGINDLGKRLSQGEGYDPHTLDDARKSAAVRIAAFSVHPDGAGSPLPRLKQTALYRLARKLKDRLVEDPRVQETTGRVYLSWRAHRADHGRILEDLPDLRAALEEFRTNLTHCVRSAKASGARVVLLDQPALWRADLEPELVALLWMGGVGEYYRTPKSDYYSPGALARGMALYNEVVHAVAKAEGVESVHVADALARDGSNFYDDVHYTELGSRRVAQCVVEALLAGRPWNQGAQREDAGREPVR